VQDGHQVNLAVTVSVVDPVQGAEFDQPIDEGWVHSGPIGHLFD
jgi:hypothetical protein